LLDEEPLCVVLVRLRLRLPGLRDDGVPSHLSSTTSVLISSSVSFGYLAATFSVSASCALANLSAGTQPKVAPLATSRRRENIPRGNIRRRSRSVPLNRREKRSSAKGRDCPRALQKLSQRD
jgi:hypothetical protein